MFRSLIRLTLASALLAALGACAAEVPAERPDMNVIYSGPADEYLDGLGKKQLSKTFACPKGYVPHGEIRYTIIPPERGGIFSDVFTGPTELAHKNAEIRKNTRARVEVRSDGCKLD